jgi:hypothetical protein
MQKANERKRRAKEGIEWGHEFEWKMKGCEESMKDMMIK